MTLDNQAYSEKRSFLRMKIDTPVEVKLTAEGETLDGVCQNLSGSGLSIAVDSALPLGTEIEVTLASEHGHHPMLKAKAKVIRASENGSGHILGLEILEMLN